MSKANAPIIEIHGTGIHNRGAELMAIAISERMRHYYPEAKITVPAHFGSPSDIKRYGLFATLEKVRKKGIPSLLGCALTGRVISANKVNVVLDASGFAFSDQWGSGIAERLVDKMNQPVRANQLFIMLPQALGAFEQPPVKTAVTKLFQRTVLVFARDTQSYNFSQPLIPNINKLRQCPDFTILLKPKVKNTIQLPKRFVAIVPNMRMVDKSGSAEDYLNFLKVAIDLIQAQNMQPIFVAHDAKEDLNVLPMLGGHYASLPIYQDADPLVLKWILGQARFVIGSRFHALVSTLSQGVPCIGAGWSHKYPELFADFSTRETLIDDLKDLHALEKQIALLSDDGYRIEKSEVISFAAANLKQQVEQMWEMVHCAIDKHLKSTD